MQRFVATIASLPLMLTWVKEQGIPFFRVELPLEEALANVIRHAQSEEIALCLTQTAEKLTIEVVDWGLPFNPLTAKPENGCGLTLLRRLTDKIEYRREEGTNHLTLHFFQASQ
jgi:anti-sigma regulatory factor (Ser/Thr protein kinase)